MKTGEFVKVLIWAVIAYAVVELSLAAINASNSILNVIACVLSVVFAFISYKTKCFINL